MRPQFWTTIYVIGFFLVPRHGLLAGQKAADRPLRIPVTEIPTSLDPHEGSFINRNKIFKQLYDNLVRLDSNAAPVPSIAKSWTIDRIKKAMSFNIEAGLKFHDGSPVTTKSVRLSLIRTIGQKHSIGRQIKSSETCTPQACPSIDIPKDGTIRIFLEHHTYDLFLKALASTDAAIVKQKAKSIIGSGPFRLASKTADKIVIKRSSSPSSADNITEIHYLKTPEKEAVSAYLSGDVDELWSNSLPETKRSKRQSQEIKFSFYGTYLFALNIHSGVFSHQPVRKAVSLSLDPLAIMETLGRSGAPASGFIPQGLLGHTIGKRTVGLDEGRKLVASAIPKANQRSLKIALHESYRSKTAFVKYLKSALKKIGLAPEIVFMQFTPALKAMKAKKVDMLFKADSVQHYDSSTIFTPLLTGNFANINHYSSPKLDEAVKLAQGAVTTQDRKRFLETAESIVANDIPIIPLFYPRRQSYYSAEIETGLKSEGEIRYWEFPYREFRWRRK